jgi:hypothetical protein
MSNTIHEEIPVTMSKIAVEETLIQFVFDHPHIYLKTSNSHHDSQLVANSWQALAETLSLTGTTASMYYLMSSLYSQTP